LSPLNRARLASFEPYLAVLVAVHGAALLMGVSAPLLPWVAVGVAAVLGIAGAFRESLVVPRGFALVVTVVAIAWHTGGVFSSVTLWLAAAALIYPAITAWSAVYLAWGVAWYIPLFLEGGTWGEAVVRAGLVVGGGVVAWGLGATTRSFADEQERTVSELHDVQGRFSAAFEHSSSGMVMFGLDGSVLRANQAMADFLGHPLEDLQTGGLLPMFHAEDRTVVESKTAELLEGEVWSFQDELRCLHSTGRVVWALVGIGLVTDGDGAPLYFFAHFQDITARVATEASLRANEEHYRTLFGQSPIPVWEMDYSKVEAQLTDLADVADVRAYLRMRIDLVRAALGAVEVKDANDAALELLEAETVAELGDRFPLLEAADGSTDALVEQLAAVFEGTVKAQGSVNVTSLRGAPIDGILHWAAPVVNDERDLSRVVLAFADFAEARKARIALQRIEERLRAVVSASPILLFALDDKGVFTLSEGQALQSLRLSPGEAVGRSAFELFRDSPELVRAVRRALAGDSLTTSADIRGRVLDMRLGPMWEDGAVSGVIGVGNDVTERTRATEQLEQLVRSKDQFVASVSHELRTPLTAVVGFAQELEHGLDRFEKVELETLVKLIAQQSIEVADLVEDLLVASRSDMDTVSVLPEAVELWEQIELVLTALGMDVTSIGDPVKVYADPIRLRQIMRNLLSNGRRYGGDLVEVESRVFGEMVVLQVRDNGDGIPVRDRAKIFDPYFRGKKGQVTGSSVGLGLTVSYQLAKLMDGDLVYRHEDGWSTFELTLPAG
ncbi:MAG: PAS domain S-box protein, partial [Acidimicrobiia bacterium]|nr:PAS domain S-box protein [Acidimicrobiia bacterium]